MSQSTLWLSVMRETVSGYRRMIDGIVEQLTDEELFARPAAEINSVAIILRHLGGNLRSRWTDFLTTDGEKPDRNRDSEFTEWEGDRESLMEYFEQGWRSLESALQTIDEESVGDTIYIRGEPHSIAQALMRSITHIAYHVGQMAIIARMVHHGQWRWLTIAPGASAAHNERTWGTPGSRAIFTKGDDGH
ncbi:MAG: hypothetical protein KatS3mg111_3254 [Pirellulaceae bacterium]|nr:MAG: hypothetical protein KatS3mg111_3254 [Pirellulaceae bacterium]